MIPMLTILRTSCYALLLKYFLNVQLASDKSENTIYNQNADKLHTHWGSASYWATLLEFKTPSLSQKASFNVRRGSSQRKKRWQNKTYKKQKHKTKNEEAKAANNRAKKHKENLWNGKIGLTSGSAGVLREICYSHWGYVVTSCGRNKEAETIKEASLQNAAVQRADKVHLDGPVVSNEKRMRSLVLQQRWVIFAPLVSAGFVRAQRAGCRGPRIHVTKKHPFLVVWNLTAAVIF